MKIKLLKRKIGFRGALMLLLVMMMPILTIIYSPVKIIIGSWNGVMTLSSVIFISWMLSALFIGRGVVCGYICPYGAFQEVTGHWLLDKKPQSTSATRIKYISFFTFFGLIIYSRRVMGGQNSFDPFLTGNQFAGMDSFGVMILVMLFMVGVGLSGILGSRAFCRYLCPQAVFLIIVTRISSLLRIPSLKLKTNPQNCNNCQLCNRVCPVGLDVMELVQKDKKEHLMSEFDCIYCGDCARACKKGSIFYKWSSA